MDFNYSEKSRAPAVQVQAFMDEHVLPANRTFADAHARGEFPLALVQELKAKGRAREFGNRGTHRQGRRDLSAARLRVQPQRELSMKAGRSAR
jgi:hypothetical protein